VICAFIDANKDKYGVEPICRVLTEHGCPIAPSTYYDARSRPPSARELRDAELKKEIIIIHKRNYSVYGAHKVWMTLRRKGIDVARCTVERLMRELDLRGVLRGRPPRTTQPNPAAARAEDRVGRNFNPLAPNHLWVADFTYVRTMIGWVYVAFVIDAYARRILGWKVSTRMTTPLVLDAINQAIWVRRTEGVTDLSGLIHHNDAGSQYTSIAFTDRLLEVGIDASIGTVGDAHDNSLAESVNGLYKTELIKQHGPWRNAAHVEAETADYLHWFNHDRLYEYCGDMPPIECEHIYYNRTSEQHAS
jgi:putative transposase